MTLPPPSLTAEVAVSRLKMGQLTVTELLQACLHRINTRDSQVHAWEYLDSESAQQQAVEWDRQLNLKGGHIIETYPLLGIPVAVKDIFATLDMPTHWGTAIYQDRYLPGSHFL